MLNESEVLALVSQSEGTKIDFKRELDLTTARNKSELIKDIIAIANSDTQDGYLILGVNDDRTVVGILGLTEEQIQQLAHRYITPSVVLTCELIPLSIHGFLSVGVITIRPTNRPHKVRNSIEKLMQDDIFIRRGSITTKASPEEIIQMYEEREAFQIRTNELKRAAETHLQLGNFQNSINLLSKAIEIAPAAELLLMRAEAFHKLQELDRDNPSWWQWGETALKDLADAITLSSSIEMDDKARGLRQKFSGFAYSNYTNQQKDDDFEYEKNKRVGIERGKWLYETIKGWDTIYRANDETIQLVKEIIECGFNEPDVYLLLAETYHGACNYGYALSEVDKLLETVGDNYPKDKLVETLCLRAKILVEMKMYKEAHETVVRAQKIDNDLIDDYFWLDSYGLPEDIIIRSVLEMKFGIGFSKELEIVLQLLLTFTKVG